MSTHIHLVLLAGSEPPGPILQAAHSPFARWLNTRQGMLGHLFAGRFRLWAVRRPTGELIAYVHNNPVRANVVLAPAASSWTSHRFYLDPENAPPWLDVERGMKLAGFSKPEAFDEYVRGLADRPRDSTWTGDADGKALIHSHEAGGAAIELGEPRLDDVASYALLVRPRSHLVVRRDYSPEQIIDAVARVLEMDRRSFCGRSKARAASRGRRLALRVWRCVRGSQAEMCAALGMSSSAACELLRSTARHHRREDEERVWTELLRSYPQKI